jgi:hypothetical protein
MVGAIRTANGAPFARSGIEHPPQGNAYFDGLLIEFLIK